MASATELRRCLPGLALLLGACVAEPASPEPLPLCAARVPELISGAAVVALQADLEPGMVSCSAVALTRTLLLTAQGCVTRPAEVGDFPDYSRVGDSFPGTVDYEVACSPDAAWLPREDGSFLARFGQRIAAEALSVSQRPSDEPRRAQQVLSSWASSRCADGLALVQLREQLEVEPLALQLQDEGYEGQPLQLSGYCSPPGLLRRRELTSVVEAVTHDLAVDGVPPRALRVSHAVTLTEQGGAVLSADTGELVGVLASGSSRFCEQADPLGSSIALRVAPFRRWLVASASALGETLRVLPGAEWASELPACASEP